MTIPDLAETPSPTADPTLPSNTPTTPVADIPAAPTPEPSASPLAGDSSPEQEQAKGSGPTPVPPPLKPQRRPLPPATNQAAIIASGKDPKQWTEVVQLGKVFGVPTDYVERNLAVLRQQYAQQQYQSQVADAHPALGHWAADANNAALAKGEIVHLNRVAQATQGLIDDHAKALADEGDGASTALASGVASQLKQMYLLAAVYGTDAGRNGWLSDAADAHARQAYLNQFTPEIVRTMAHKEELRDQLYEGYKALAREGMHEMGQGGPTAAGIAPRLKGIADAVVGGAMTVREGLLNLLYKFDTRTLPYKLEQSAAGLALPIAAVAAGAATGNPLTAFAASIGGFVPLAVGNRVEKLIAERADLGDPVALQKALADPVFRNKIRAEAGIGGVTEATVMGTIGALSGIVGTKVAGRMMASSTPEVAKVAAESFAKGLPEAATREAVAGALAKAPVWKAALAEHAISAVGNAVGVAAGQQAGDITTGSGGSVNEFLKSTGDMLLFGEAMHLTHLRVGDSPMTRAVDVTMKAGRAMDALRRGALLNEAGAAVREAPNTASQPDRLGDLVKGVTGSDEHPTIYFQKDEWDATMKAAGLDPAATASEILDDKGAGYAATVDTDAPLAVPLDKLLAKAAPTEWWGKVKEIARHTPDGPTAKEAQSDLSTTEEQLKGTLAEIATSDLKSRPPLTEYGQQLLAIRNEYLSQFAGQRPADLGFGGGHAEVMANTMASFIHAQASRMGITPREAMALMPSLDFSRGIEGAVEGLKQRLPARVPFGVNASVDLNAPMYSDLETLQQHPDLLNKSIDAISADAGLKVPGKGLDRLEPLLQKLIDNLLWLHDKMPEKWRQRAKLWYDGARAIARRWEATKGLSREQISGILATQSPQKDWYMNVSLGERIIDITQQHMDHQFDEKMRLALFPVIAGEANSPAEERTNTARLAQIEGKTLRELAGAKEWDAAGMWVRAYDEAYHSPSHAIVTPEGEFRENVLKGDGEGEAKLGWGGMATIGKAVQIIMDGSPASISDALGGEHKVRNFYNNIWNPDDANFTTMDTHAVAAAELRPLSGASPAVEANFGSTGSRAETGMAGAYGLFHEAYRRAAEARGILPREMQSITWEAVRGLFEDTFKSQKKNGEEIDRIWAQVDDGTLTHAEARDQIFAYAGGITPPSWTTEPEHPVVQDASYQAGEETAPARTVAAEVAPNSRNTDATTRWNALPPEVRAKISKEVLLDVMTQVVGAFATKKTESGKWEPTGVKARLAYVLGGWGPDVNQSAVLRFDDNTSTVAIIRIARALGYILNQDAIGVTSPHPFSIDKDGAAPSGEATQAIAKVLKQKLADYKAAHPKADVSEGTKNYERIAKQARASVLSGDQMTAISVGLGVDTDAQSLYLELRDAIRSTDGAEILQGHTSTAKQMAILVPTDGSTELAKRIADYLGDRHDVTTGDVYAHFLSKGDNDYGLSGSQTDGTLRPDTSLRDRWDRIRAETARTLDARIAEAEAAGRSAAAPAEGVVPPQTLYQRVASAFPNAWAPPFYSKAERLVAEKVPNNATPDQVKATLAGIKAEERKWLDIDEFLEGKEKVRKDELLAWIAAHNIIARIVEDVRGGKPAINNAERIEELTAEYEQVLEMRDELRLRNPDESLEGLWEPEDRAEYERLTREEARIRRERQNLADEEDVADTKFGRWTVGDGKLSDAEEAKGYRRTYREILFTMPDILQSFYHENHWGRTRNVIGHIRSITRDVWRDGVNLGKALLVEEIQTDAQGQARKRVEQEIRRRLEADGLDPYKTGKKSAAWKAVAEAVKADGFTGYYDPAKDPVGQDLAIELRELKDERDTFWSGVEQALEEKDKAGESAAVTPEQHAKFAKMQKAIDRAQQRLDDHYEREGQKSDLVPKFPFKGKWHEFSLKRMIRMAAEEGFDRIAWVTGATTQDRYSLAKHADTAQYDRETQTLTLWKDGAKVYDNFVAIEDLADTIGDGPVQRLFEMEPITARQLWEQSADKVKQDALKVRLAEARDEYATQEKASEIWLADHLPADAMSAGDRAEQIDGLRAALTDAGYDLALATKDVDRTSPRSEFWEIADRKRKAAEQRLAKAEKAFADADSAGQAEDAIRGKNPFLRVLRTAGRNIDSIDAEIRELAPDWEDGTVERHQRSVALLDREIAALEEQKRKLDVDGSPFSEGDSSITRLEEHEYDAEMRLQLEEYKRSAEFYAEVSMDLDAALVRRERILLSIEKLIAKADEPRSIITGEDISVGGEWAFNLYDKTITNVIKGMGKNYGAVIEDTQVENGDGTMETVHSMTIPQALKDAALGEGFELFQGKVAKEQGAIQGSTLFRPDGSINIQFFQKADKSTFFHELAHYYTAALQHLSTVAPDTEAKGKYVADLAALRDWVGAKEGDALTVPQHEQIARGFEQYLQEGKAPSVRLRDAFYRIREWMLKLYKGLNVHGVQLTPEVRSVFDRMLASDAEIAEAERQSLGTPLFGDDPRSMGLSDAQAQSLQQARDDAHQKAIEQQTAKRMKEITRREKKKWKAWRDPIEAEVTAQVDADPVQMAIAHLSKHETPAGVPLSEDLVPQVKLSKAALVAAYGEDILNGIPRAMVSTEEGVPADVIADLYGFENGRDFLDAVRASKPRDLAIREETDARMEMLHGQEMTPDAAKMAAQEYVMGAGRKAVLRKELEILASDSMSSLKNAIRLVTKRIPPPEETKLRATAIIADTKVGAVRPDLFRTAAFRAGNEAREALLKGDLELAMAKKKQELLATAIYDEAIAQRDRIDKAMEQMRKLFRSDAKLESKHDLTFINGARALLGSLGIGTDRAYGSAVGYLTLSKEYAPEAHAAVEALSEDIAKLGVSDYRKLTVGQFDEVLKTVDQLWELSTNAKTVLMDGRKQALADVLAPMLVAAKARRVDRIATRGIARQMDLVEQGEGHLLSFAAMLTRVESWARAMDGLDVNGPYSSVVRMVKDATNAYRLRQQAILPHLVEVSEGLRGLPNHRDIKASEFGYTFRDMKELLGALLHTGNAEGSGSNLEKLLLGRGWATKDAETGVVDTSRWDAFIRRMWKEGVLTKAHYDWAQAVWDTFEGMKPDLQRAFLGATGRHMTEVAHTGFDTPFGHYKGGYYPAIGDQSVGKIFDEHGVASPMTVQIANAMRYAEENTLGHDSKFTNVQPAAGMTKQRTGAIYPLVMDATQVPRHLDATMKYIELSVPIRDAFKVFNNREFREAMDGINPTLVEGALMPFLKAAGSQQSSAPATTKGGRAFEKGMNWIRTGAMKSIIALNPTILAEMVAHLTTIQSLRTPDNKAVVYYHDVLQAMARITLSQGKMTEWIHKQSPTVATRDHRGLERAMLDYKQLIDPSRLRTAQEETAHTIGFVSHVISSLLDKAVWLGAYDRATARKLEPGAARHIADNAVREGLGGHNAEDLADVQRAPAINKMLQGFYGFFNAKLNQFGTDAFAQTMTEAGLKRDKMRMATVYALGFAMMAVTGHGVRQLVSGKKEEEDGDDRSFGDALLHWAGWAVDAQIETGFALFPYTGAGRGVYDATKAFWGGHRPSSRDNTLSSPFTQAGQQAVGTIGAVFHAARGEDITGKDIKDALGLFATLSHIPTAIIARPAAYLQDVHQGRATPTGPLDFTRGLLTGQRGGK